MHALVHVAGGARGTDRVEDGKPEDWRWMFEANVLSAQLVTAALLPLLRAGAAPLYEPALPVEVVDTIGAGDSFNAGVLAALQAAGALDDPAHAAAETLARAVRHGIKVAAATVGRQGADPPWARDLPAEAGPPAAG